MSLAKSLPSQCASRAASALRGQRPLPQVCRNKRLDTVQTPGGNVVSLQGSMILASRGFSVIFPQGLTNSMASVVSVLLPARFPFSSRAVPTPRPGASRCCCARLCYACAVATGPAPHDRSASFPCTGKTQGKQAGQHTASRSWEELLQVDAVIALKIVASRHPARGSCSPCEDKQVVPTNCATRLLKS